MPVQSRNGSNHINGSSGNDHLNGGAGADDIFGGNGNDRINGGSGNDLLDGGRGADIVNGDAGDDTLVWNMTENAGSTDTYDGGSGRDTLLLDLTGAQWRNPAVQSEIARFLAFMAQVTNPANGQASNANFTFSFGLTVSKIEALRVLVDGVELDPRDEAVVLGDDAMSAGEETASIAVNVLANDSVPDLISSLTHTQPAHGSVTMNHTVGAPASPDTAQFVYTPNSAHWQYLAAGQTATDTFTYTVTDADGDTRSATVTVTITGSNDAPVLGAAVTQGAVVEDASSIATGQIGFSDIDLADAHTVSAQPTGQGYVGVFTAQMTDDGAGDGAGSVTWTFQVDPAVIQGLAAGQTLTQTYAVSISDGNGGSVSQPVTVTITGSNDAPVITGAVASGSVSETSPVTASTAPATPVVLEMESNDTFGTAQVIDRAMLRIAPNANLGDQTDPSISVQGSVSAPGAQDVFRIDLAAGELLTLDVDFAAGYGSGAFPGYPAGFGLDSFVFIYDANGNLLNFNDDAPVNAGGTGSVYSQDSYLQFASATGGTFYIVVKNWDGNGATSAGPYRLQVSVDSQNLQLTDAGTISFADVDVTDGHTVSVASQGAGYLGALTASVSDASTGDGAGTVNWQFSVANAAVQFLGAGETRTQVYTVTVNDGHGGTTSQDVTVTITGENDGPVISSAFSSGSYTEDQAAAVGGTINFDDVDLSDAHTVTSAPEGSGYRGTFTATLSDTATGPGGGQVTWTYSATSAELASLAQGQSLLQRYIVTIDDGNGGTTQQLVNVTIVGTNDAPVITSAVSSGSIVEDEVSTAAGEIAFAGIDLADSHTVTSAANGDGYYGVFTAVMNDNAAGDGQGVVGWTFQVDPAAINHLAQGQTLTQTYTVTVSDGKGGAVDQVVTVFITGADDGPVVQGEVINGFEDQPIALDLLANDTGLGLSVTHIEGQSIYPWGSVALQDGGQVSMDWAGNLTYQPAANASGTVNFGYTATDSNGVSANATATVNVAATADAPIIAVGSSTTLNPTNGSAMKTTLNLQAGDVVTFTWDFVAHDYMPFNDFSYATVNGAAYMLGAVQVVGDYGTTGWKTFTFTATQSGSYTFGVGVSNVNDQSLNAHLLIDNLQVNGVVVSSFENGAFTGWTRIGAGAVQTSHDGVNPTDGVRMAYLDSSGQTTAQIESFLGLAPGRLKRIAEAAGEQGDSVVVPIALTLGAGEAADDTYVTITGFPEGSTFNFGAFDPMTGGWRVPAADLGGNLQISTPDDYSGSFTLTVVGTTQLDNGSVANTAPQTITVVIDAASGALMASAMALSAESIKGQPTEDGALTQPMDLSGEEGGFGFADDGFVLTSDAPAGFKGELGPQVQPDEATFDQDAFLAPVFKASSEDTGLVLPDETSGFDAAFDDLGGLLVDQGPAFSWSDSVVDPLLSASTEVAPLQDDWAL